MSTDLTANPHARTELQRYAEALLANLAADATRSTTSTIPTSSPDVPGYWLAPAVQALVLLVRGEDALEPLGRAAQLDEQRTALFLCLALALCGQGDRIHASWMGIAFGELSLDQPVTRGQRALWLAAAQGAYGPAGKIFVLRKLDAVAVPSRSEPARWLSALTPHEPSMVVPPSLVDFPELAELPELAQPVQAAAQLTRLLGRCTEITTTRAGAGGKPAGRAGRPPTPWAANETLSVLRQLIGADAADSPGSRASGASGASGASDKAQNGPGAPDRAANGFGGSEAPDRAAKPLTDHLLADLRACSDPSLAAIALHVVAPIVRTAAEGLAKATQVSPPESVTMPLLGHRVILRPGGPNLESLAAAERHIAVESVPVRGRPWLAYALLALTVLALVAAVVTPFPLPAAALALVLAAGGAHQLWLRRERERADAEYVRKQLSELRELADGAVWALHEYGREAEKRAQGASSDLAELTRLLRRGPRAG
ncbi:hypothetical protein [Streptosporangium carneum]|uniref:hypothetical protein n=1 Tax=Streptosporangium carneum TaxID=47481 RepID=UPI0022F32212|nr:hypothetical protein [Streptosporangium carneum]